MPKQLDDNAFDIFAVTSEFVNNVKFVLDAKNQPRNQVDDSARGAAMLQLYSAGFDPINMGALKASQITHLENLAKYLEALKELYDDPHLTTTGAELLTMFNTYHSQHKAEVDDLITWLNKGSIGGNAFFPDDVQVKIDMYDPERCADKDRPSAGERQRSWLGNSALTDAQVDGALRNLTLDGTSDQLFSSIEALAGSFDGTTSSTSSTSSTTGPSGPSGPVGPGPGDGANPGDGTDGRGDGV